MNIEDFKNQVIQGDCLEVMKDIPDKSIDMILCDLPYGTTACKWDTIIPFEPLWEQYKRIIKDNGAIVLTASQPFTSALVMSNVNGFSHQWVWNKGMAANPLLANKMPLKDFEDVLVFYSINVCNDDNCKNIRDFLKQSIEKSTYTHNEILSKIGLKNGTGIITHWTTKNKKTYQVMPSVDKWFKLKEILCFDDTYDALIKDINTRERTYNPQMAELDRERKIGLGGAKKSGFMGIDFSIKQRITKYSYPKSILTISNKKELQRFHPTQKPVALFEYLIKTYTNEGDLVLDNCAGSGTAGVACKNTNRNYILIEKEKEYIDIINKRLQ